jgi:hypothetical protein
MGNYVKGNDRGLKFAWKDLQILQNLTQDSRSQRRDLSTRPPKYEGVLTAAPRRSVKSLYVHIYKFTDRK